MSRGRWVYQKRTGIQEDGRYTRGKAGISEWVGIPEGHFYVSSPNMGPGILYRSTTHTVGKRAVRILLECCLALFCNQSTAYLHVHT